MPAQFAIGLVGAHDHRERIPAHDRGQPLFDGQVARVAALLLDRNGVAVGRIRLHVRHDAQLLGLLFQPLEQEQAALGAAFAHGGLQRVYPFLGFGGVAVACGGDQLIEQGGGFASGHGGSPVRLFGATRTVVRRQTLRRTIPKFCRWHLARRY